MNSGGGVIVANERDENGTNKGAQGAAEDPRVMGEAAWAGWGSGAREQRLGGLMKELRNVARPCPLIREDKGCYNSRRRPRES